MPWLARAELRVCAGERAEDERNRMFADKIVGIIGQSLLAVVASAHPPRPFFTESVVLEAVHHMPRAATREESQKQIWEQV